MIQKFKVAALKKFTANVFTKAGIPAPDAEMMAEVLVVTDMRGVHSHGVVRSARYIDCIQAGRKVGAVYAVYFPGGSSQSKRNGLTDLSAEL